VALSLHVFIFFCPVAIPLATHPVQSSVHPTLLSCPVPPFLFCLFYHTLFVPVLRELSSPTGFIPSPNSPFPPFSPHDQYSGQPTPNPNCRPLSTPGQTILFLILPPPPLIPLAGLYITMCVTRQMENISRVRGFCHYPHRGVDAGHHS
jgi:hypothetical protein